MSAMGNVEGRYRLVVLRSIAEIAAVAEDWRALERRCQSAMSYFQTYDWCANWLEIYARRIGGPVPHIRTVWEGETLVAVWPLMISGNGLSLRRLETLGEPHSQYCNLICAPDASQLVVRALLEDLFASGESDVVVLKPVPEHSSLGQVLNALPQIEGYQNEASVLDLSGFATSEDYTNGLGKTQKRNRNRRRNHLAREGDLSFEVIWPGDARFAELVALSTVFKKRWLKETQRFSLGFSMPDYDLFLSRLTGDAGTLSGACLSVLRVGERVAAIELGFIRNGHYYAYIGGFDWDLRDLSPGKVQMEMTVCWLIDNGVTAYDLLTNPADYKQSWSNSAVGLSGYAVPVSWKGHLYARAWLPRVRPAFKRAHAKIPEMVQRLGYLGRGLGCVILYV